MEPVDVETGAARRRAHQALSARLALTSARVLFPLVAPMQRIQHRAEKKLYLDQARQTGEQGVGATAVGILVSGTAARRHGQPVLPPHAVPQCCALPHR